MGILDLLLVSDFLRQRIFENDGYLKKHRSPSPEQKTIKKMEGTFYCATDCKHLISQVPQVKVTHCYQEANCCADGLARLRTQQDADVLFYNFPLPTREPIKTFEWIGISIVYISLYH